ncbi:protein disulfide oxidoreductase [Yersinia ruckeri]|uniref:Membrane protein, suppressor for copper-sensitivity ScsD n=1 Tax=Yersinia ruckeri TaxID=29486 RepID=A0A085U4Z9_YERRU|nr:protein disulfide oxidoreductase [Yersinia ruckeri]AKA37814.1 alkyl hydroperoxide reductase [Yersinia ruckeri]ARZ00356.1 metal resistance protein [Yersinia ruckeri]AUQ42462.1 protein disulfide oxidoreductase [Yersinia ruckeri]EKN3346909.1 protein disulfide oxidoreductase [Yersinia ruckeri]EKN3362169.1 protein disulfide oxidoreductase [Yersinia ruckeri]
MNRLKRWGYQLAILLAMVLVLSLGMDWLRSPQVPPNWGSEPLVMLNGETVSLQALSEDKPLLVYFWASWCGVCKFTTPSVNTLVADGENVITVALRSGNDRQVEQWLTKKGQRLPVINDPMGQLSAKWQIGVTPTLAILYRGELVSSTSGWTSYWGMKLRLWWAGL